MTINVKIYAPYELNVARDGDGAFDLRATEDFVVFSRERELVSTGVRIEIPEGYAGLIVPRSGLASKKGITITNAPGLIDSGYRGEVKVIIQNTGRELFQAAAGDRIAQLMIIPVPQVHFDVVDSPSELSDTERGAQGFGSTGVQ